MYKKCIIVHFIKAKLVKYASHISLLLSPKKKKKKNLDYPSWLLHRTKHSIFSNPQLSSFSCSLSSPPSPLNQTRAMALTSLLLEILVNSTLYLKRIPFWFLVVEPYNLLLLEYFRFQTTWILVVYCCLSFSQGLILILGWISFDFGCLVTAKHLMITLWSAMIGWSLHRTIPHTCNAICTYLCQGLHWECNIIAF